MLRRSIPLLAVLLFLSSSTLARSAPSLASEAKGFPVPPVRARAAVVMDATNGKVLAGINPHLHLPMASTTKIMTALLALKMGSLSDRIKVPKAAFNFEWDATVMGLHPGQVVTLRDLLYGLMLPSGADAANTIAIHYGGSEAHFVALMNQEARALGMHDTHYANAHGLTASNHYTSAYDLALLAQYVSYLPDLMTIASTRQHTWNGHVLVNLNHVLFWYPGVDGIKPGYTDDAGICQVLDAKRHGQHVVVAILNTPDLVIDARNLLNFGLRDYTWIQSPLTNDSPWLMQTGADSAGPFTYFPASGHYLRGKFRTAFSPYGGLESLGFPRSEQLHQGDSVVQYFENGELVQDLGTGRLSRPALGLTDVPRPSATVTPVPITPTPTPLPASEGSLHLTGTPTGRPTPTRTVTSGRSASPKPSATATRVVRKPTPAPTQTGPLKTAGVFSAFQRSHTRLLGGPAGPLRHFRGYPVQFFAYSALVYDRTANRVYMLPLGDRLLSGKDYLPDYPGNSYPPGFAPVSLLKTIGWPPYK